MEPLDAAGSARDLSGEAGGEARSPATRLRAYRGSILTPLGGPADPVAPTIRHLDDGVLVVDERGRIVAVEPFAPGAARGLVMDLRPAVLLPGFVDAHLHYPQTRVVGSASGPLLDWLEATVFPEEARFADPAYARAVARELTSRLVAAGTTTIATFSSSSPVATHVLFEALLESGLRAFAGLTLMDQRCPEAIRVPADRALRACEELAAEWHGCDEGRLAFAVTPRFAPSCSRALLEGAARLAADRGLLVQTHVAEHPAEAEETLRVHPFASDYVDVYDRVGLLGERTLLAHAIHLSASEWDRLAERGARVAHCPDSNFFLGSGRMRVNEAFRRRIPVALGTDVAAGRSFSVPRTMASAYDSSLCLGVRLSAAALFRMATLGGAEALGLDAVIGSLEPGKEADFIAIELPDYVRGEERMLAAIAFADTWRVARTFVRGRAIGELV